MESNILTAVFLPLALFIIMLGMGLSLVPGDFKRVFIYPKATILGLINQLILLPLVAFGLCVAFNLPGELAVGMMILSACPGGATSNLITHLSKGDIALSITLTAISSFITVLTIPIITNLSLEYFMKESEIIKLPVLETIAQVIGITILPVSIGMIIKRYKSELSSKVEKPLKTLSAVFLVIIILGAILKNKADIIDFFVQAGPVALALNIATLAIGYFSSTIFGLTVPQRRTISIESGIQNGTLAIAVAASILKNPQMSISPAIYSLIMFFTAGFLIFSVNRKKA